MSSQLFVTAHLTTHDKFFIDVLPKGAVDVKQGTQARCWLQSDQEVVFLSHFLAAGF